MFDSDTEIYQFIGNALRSVVNNDWNEIVLNVELTEGSIGYNGQYLDSKGNKDQYDLFSLDDNLNDAFEELYQMMTAKSDKHKWNKAKVTLTHNGDFNIKFDWDQEMYDEIERLNNEYDPRWDDTLTKEEKIKAYEKVKNTM